jgi:hypothetical protein
MFSMLLRFTEEEGGGKNGSKAHVSSSVADGPQASQQQQDWSIVWEYFDNPHKLLVQAGGGLSKVMHDMVCNAVAEMRRYYSRKVVDVLIKVTRHSLDCLRKRFISDSESAGWFFLSNFINTCILSEVRSFSCIIILAFSMCSNNIPTLDTFGTVCELIIPWS